MKIFCIRYPRNTVTDFLICLLCIFIITLILINAKSGYMSVSAVTESVDVLIEDNGWIVDKSRLVISEKKLPFEFDDTYEEYNQLQCSQGFELNKYKGCMIQHYSYPLLNFPEYEDSDSMFLNVFVYNNEIIAADICNIAVDGFITGVIQNGKDSS